ncbi:MAG: hypothetical protein D6756_05630, partial [Cyanobacteria bacterium J083]
SSILTAPFCRWKPWKSWQRFFGKNLLFVLKNNKQGLLYISYPSQNRIKPIVLLGGADLG